MKQQSSTLSRRDALTGALLLGMGNACGANSAHGAAPTPAAGALANDFAFLIGAWRVRHHKLKGRLVGSTEWSDFEGTCRAWTLLGEAANVDDNVLHAPDGQYRGVTLRRRQPDTGKWWIWWLDDMSAGLEPPVVGEFKDGVGTFFGDDQLRGQPIRVRFIWSEISARAARWEQAFSPDQGRTWEANWVMHFERDA
jgi:hypothetical protein